MLGGRRAILVSSLSTVVFVLAMLSLLYLAPGSASFRNTFLNFTEMKQAFLGVPSEGIPPMWKAFLTVNVVAFLVAEVLILLLALVIAVIRQIPGPVFFPLRAAAIIFTDFFRGTPLLLVILLFGFGLPGLYLHGISTQPPFVYGMVALVLSYSAYVAEVYRAGIESVHRSQMASARSLGLTLWQSLRFVVLPQAIRRVIPPLLNDFVSLQKDTALLSLLGVLDAVRVAQLYADYTFNYSSYVMAAILFILCTIPLARFTDHLIQKGRRRREMGDM
jgi:polar amino acid transport system permease protein